MGGTLNTIASVVDNMAVTLAFYRQLGLAIPAEADTCDHVVVELGGGIRMGWNTIALELSFNPDWEPPDQPGRMGVTFRYESPDQVDETYRRLIASGHDSPVPPFDAPWGNRHCRMLDPDGNAVDLFAKGRIKRPDRSA